MNGYDCDTARDLLTLLGSGKLQPVEETRAQAHLAACEDCRAEHAVVRLIQSTLEPLPAGLEARILAAVRDVESSPAAPTRVVGPQPRQRLVRRPARVRLALAATVATAFIGGTLVMNRVIAPGSEPVSAGPELEVSVLDWVAADDAMLRAGPALTELSLDELEQLLEELES